MFTIQWNSLSLIQKQENNIAKDTFLSNLMTTK